MKTIAVIPAYNEERMVGRVVCGLNGKGYDTIVVDDGSTDATGEEARHAGAFVVRHCVNRGLGGAIATGIVSALCRGADIIVTFDADGQHDTQDIARVIEPIVFGKADVVIGSRFLRKNTIPLTRRCANAIGNTVTYCLFGLWVSDSQSGLRAFSCAAAEQIHLTANRMDISSEIIKEIYEKKLRYVEIPISVRYTSYSLSKGQGFLEGIKTFLRLLLHRLNR